MILFTHFGDDGSRQYGYGDDSNLDVGGNNFHLDLQQKLLCQKKSPEDSAYNISC